MIGEINDRRRGACATSGGSSAEINNHSTIITSSYRRIPLTACTLDRLWALPRASRCDLG